VGGALDVKPGSGATVTRLHGSHRLRLQRNLRHRAQRIEAAPEAAGQLVAQPDEAWTAAGPSRGGVRVLITGRQGFERTVAFTLDEAPATITEQVRATIED
jgi:hypothetical protein